MVVDTSALIAILEREEDAETIVSALEGGSLRLISAGTLLECTIVALARRGEAGVDLLREFVSAAGIETVSVTSDLAKIAYEGYVRYGKGRHAAGLNFGDCFAYALAKNTGESLLFKGNDFAKTDLVAALPPR